MLGTQEAEAGRSQVRALPGLRNGYKTSQSGQLICPKIERVLAMQ